MVVRIGGDGLADMLERELKKPTPTGVTSYEVIQHISGRYTVVVRLDVENRIPLPNGVNVPGIDIFLNADGLAPIFQKLLKEANDLKQVTADGRTFFEVTEAASGTTLKPVFVFENDAFVVGSSRAFTWECLGRTKDGLASQPDFQRALASVGTEGNGLSYVTPRFFDEVREALVVVKAARPDAAGVIDLWAGNIPELSRPLVSVRSNLPDGILTRSYSFRSSKQEVLIGANGPVTIGLLAAMAIPAFQKVRANSQEKVVQNNLRQFQAVAQQHMLDTGKTSAGYSDVVGTGEGKYIRELRPVAGEDYESLVLKEGDTEILVTTASGKVISMPVY